MKIHMAQDKYIMGNNRLSRAKKTATLGVAGGDSPDELQMDVVSGQRDSAREEEGKWWVVGSLIIGRHETKPIALMANEMRTKLMDSLISEIILSACPRVRVSACLIISSNCHPKHINSSCLQICIQNIRTHSLLLLV